jgi:hypothetical protein
MIANRETTSLDERHTLAYNADRFLSKYSKPQESKNSNKPNLFRRVKQKLLIGAASVI